MAFIAKEPFSSNATSPIKFRLQYESIRIINVSTTDITFSLSPYFTYTIAPGEVFDEQVDPFDTLTFTIVGIKGFVRDEV